MSGSGRAETTPGPWGVHAVPPQGELRVGIGPLVLRFTQEAGEIRMALRRDGEGVEASARGGPGEERGGGRETAGAPPAAPVEAAGEALVEDVEWTRWAPATWSGEVCLSPVFPDRPLVVAPGDAFWLLDGAEARIYVRIPLDVHVEALGTPRSTLTTVPTLLFSDTWWGTVEEGELFYWLGTEARRGITEDLYTHHLALCPLQLVNRSGDELHVDKIAVRGDYLSLYGHEGRAIWADETRVRYVGDVEGSRLEVAGAPPAEAPEAVLLAPPRKHLPRGFRARTFARLRSIHGWV